MIKKLQGLYSYFRTDFLLFLSSLVSSSELSSLIPFELFEKDSFKKVLLLFSLSDSSLKYEL